MVAVGAAAGAVLITAASDWAVPDDVAPLVVNVDPHHAVFAGAVGPA